MAATKPPPKIQKESIWRTLPRACFGLIAAVVLDVVAMLGYATLLLMDGASPSAFYFAAVVPRPEEASIVARGASFDRVGAVCGRRHRDARLVRQEVEASRKGGRRADGVRVSGER